MSYELRTDGLVRKTKFELIETMKVEVMEYEEAEDGGDGEGHNHLTNLEQIVYTLKNCDYEGKK